MTENLQNRDDLLTTGGAALGMVQGKLPMAALAVQETARDCGDAIELDTLKHDWESLAERDALGSILTDASKSHGGWDLAEFMATGEAEIEVVMGHLRNLGRTPDFSGAALDFGCGVGRLTQPLARRFASCAGVDISLHMIEQDEAHNEYAHCSFVAHAGAELPFAGESFAFVYSNIVLQHMQPRFAERYLREFVRVLAPGGVLVFGVQDSFAAPDLASLVARARQVLRVRSRIQAALRIGPRHMQMHCLGEAAVRKALGAAKVVDVQLTNTAAKDFNGRLVYLRRPPASGYVGKQYCVVKE